jgi:hypothetical protein
LKVIYKTAEPQNKEPQNIEVKNVALFSYKTSAVRNSLFDIRYSKCKIFQIPLKVGLAGEGLKLLNGKIKNRIRVQGSDVLGNSETYLKSVNHRIETVS